MFLYGGRGGRGRGGDVTHRLRPPPHGGIVLQITGMGPVGVKQQLTSSDMKLVESTEEMGTDVTGDWAGGGGCAEVRNVLNRDGSGGNTLQVRYVGRVPADWEEAWRFSPSNDTTADGLDVTAERGWDIDVPYPGGGNVGGRHTGGGELNHLPSEHHCNIYRDKAHYGPMLGAGAAPRGTGFEAVVGTGGTRSGGDMGGGVGGRGGEVLGGAVGRGV